MAKKVSFYLEDSPTTKPDEFDYDVIIIGSGVAGLSAAYMMIKKNCDINLLILEGSDKLGGRLGISGATRGFFIDDKQTHINRLISDLGLKTEYRRKIEHYENSVYYARDGPIIKTEDMFDEINVFIDRLDLTAASIYLKSYANYPQAETLACMSLNAMIGNHLSGVKAQEFFEAIAYSICGVEATSVSALWFIIMAIGAGGLKRRIKFALGSNERLFVTDGASKILEKLLEVFQTERIEIQTESVVDMIEFNDVYAYVSVRDGEQYKCEYVIVAVPPPENSKILIRPPNKNVFKHQKCYEHGKGTFFIASYDEPWWLRNNYSGEILGSTDNENGLRIIYETTTSSPVYLAGFLNRGIKKSSHPLEALQNCWTPIESNEAAYWTKFKSYTEWEWPGTNEGTGITEGGYPMSVMKPSHIKTHFNPMLIPHKRHYDSVYWACSEYARCWPGTLDGAVESGEYVAGSILFHLRPQSLNSQELRFITPDTVAEKNDLPLDLVALHFVIMGIVTAVLILYCKPVKLT